MRVVVAGSHGFLGSALVERLRARGDEVTVLVRGGGSGPGRIPWDPDAGRLDGSALVGHDAVVDLAGVNPASLLRTPARKRAVVQSRLRTASLLARTLAETDGAPRVFLQASGIGAYGDRGEDLLDESEPYGDTFFAQIAQRWEAATTPASDAGVRVVHLRTSLVLGPGGALGRLLPLIRAGLGGRLGSGRQFWSWISLVDEVRAMEHLLTADVHGPVNLVAHADRNADVVAALARAVHRPAVLAVPAPVIRVALGDFSSEILGSVNAVPGVLDRTGFTPQHTDLDPVAAWVVHAR